MSCALLAFACRLLFAVDLLQRQLWQFCVFERLFEGHCRVEVFHRPADRRVACVDVQQVHSVGQHLSHTYCTSHSLRDPVQLHADSLGLFKDFLHFKLIFGHLSPDFVAEALDTVLQSEEDISSPNFFSALDVFEPQSASFFSHELSIFSRKSCVSLHKTLLPW